MAAEYFHVVTYEATGRRHLILSDLSERDLKARFLQPRSRGATELVGDRVFDFGTLDQVTIARTTSPKLAVLAAYDRLRNKGADEFNSEELRAAVCIGSRCRFPRMTSLMLVRT